MNTEVVIAACVMAAGLLILVSVITFEGIHRNRRTMESLKHRVMTTSVTLSGMLEAAMDAFDWDPSSDITPQSQEIQYLLMTLENFQGLSDLQGYVFVLDMGGNQWASSRDPSASIDRRSHARPSKSWLENSEQSKHFFNQIVKAAAPANGGFVHYAIPTKEGGSQNVVAYVIRPKQSAIIFGSAVPDALSRHPLRSSRNIMQSQ